jgi:hypothetical protein
MYFLFSPPIKKEYDASVCTSYGRNLAIWLLTVVLKAELLWRVTSKSLHQSVWLVARFSLSLFKFFHSPHSPPLSFELKQMTYTGKTYLNNRELTASNSYLDIQCESIHHHILCIFQWGSCLPSQYFFSLEKESVELMKEGFHLLFVASSPSWTGEVGLKLLGHV